jgi:hypothetical protein
MRPDVPSPQHLAALKAIAHLERGTPAEINAAHAQECCTAGWAIDAPGDNQYRLTEAGREVLTKASELEG